MPIPAAYDIAIIGAGPCGLSFAKALGDTNLNILVLERQDEKTIANPAYDGREIALTHLTQQNLQKYGIWNRLPAEDISLIKHAEVLNGDSSYSLHFSHIEAGEENLGFMISNHLIRQAAYDSHAGFKGNVTLQTNAEITGVQTNQTGGVLTLSDGTTIEAKLIVAADSRFSSTRKMMGIETEMLDFHRTCIVCKMDYDAEECDTAFECFHYDRTLAVLPLTRKRASIVITVDSAGAEEIINMDETDFAKDIANRVDGMFGDMTLTTQRYSYPLMGTYARQFYAPRYALLGDAAVGMHPVTAHGFNLGLRGAECLSSEIKNALQNGLDFGSTSVLRRYHRAHRKASRPIYLGTNALVKLYTNTSRPAKLVRRALLHLGNTLTPAKRMITNLLTETKTAT